MLFKDLHIGDRFVETWDVDDNHNYTFYCELLKVSSDTALCKECNCEVGGYTDYVNTEIYPVLEALDERA